MSSLGMNSQIHLSNTHLTMIEPHWNNSLFEPTVNKVDGNI